MQTIIFDLDGTLYEDERVYDLYALELADRLTSEQRGEYLRDWEIAKQGSGHIRIGMGYDADRDLLFSHTGNRITSYLDWSGQAHPASPPPSPKNAADDPTPPTDLGVFGPGRYNVGDWWGLASTLAAHHGIQRDAMREAFVATRDGMHADNFHLRVDAPFMHLVRQLHAGGVRTIAMSNSPADSVDIVIDRLGIRPALHRVIGMGMKPAGLTSLLEELGSPADILSVGDNFVNDIGPALDHGSSGLYIDRHNSRIGAGHPHCHLVRSIGDAREWLSQRYGVKLTTQP